MIVTRLAVRTATFTVLLGLLAVEAAASASHRWSDAFLPGRQLGGGRSLQSCSSEESAYHSCIVNELTDDEVDACDSCVSASNAASNLYETDCSSVNDFFCAPAYDCACMSPCRVQYANFAECYIEAGFAEEGETFTCDINCGSNSGGGGSGGEDSSSSSGSSGSGSSSSGGGGGTSESDNPDAGDSGGFQKSASAFAFAVMMASALSPFLA